MASFLMENDLLSNYQFGFIKGRSTTLQLLNVLNDWTQSIENKNAWTIKRHLIKYLTVD